MKPIKLSKEDREDLFKYTRYFALKAIQIIVSSRSGHREPTPCGKKSDWFNLNVLDRAGLFSSAKKSVSSKINYGCPVCVEMSLKTPEGDKMILETWCIRLLAQYSDPCPKITHTVYNQMGILLKSLVSVTRVVPAYKLSQRQGPETYTLFFRLYENEPEIHNLGEGCKQVRIGQICTPIGTLQISVAYRVKMTITPTEPSCRESSMLLKSDHFDAELSPKLNRKNQSDDKSKNKGQHIMAAFADPKPPRNKEPPAALKPGGVLWQPKFQMSRFNQTSPHFDNGAKRWSLPAQVLNPNTAVSLIVAEDLNRPRTCSETSEDSNHSEKSYSNENLSIVPKLFRHSNRRIGKGLNYPFATPTSQDEVIRFYRHCVHAPPLESLADNTRSLSDIAEQLEAFEEKAKEFDELVKSICDSSESDD